MRDERSKSTRKSKAGQWAFWLALAMAAGYGLIAALHTVADPDLGWQMATARWIMSHHAIPRADVFSYTAQGKEWIYPVLSQLIEYGIFRAGGYPLLSWMAALACAGTIALLVFERSSATALIAIVAVPIIALRSSVRADMFSQVLFAVFVCLLWRFHRTGRGPLWSLPVLMALWVNLHLGFMAGLGMCAAYIGLEVGDYLFPERRAEAAVRLRKSAPWLGATLLATLINPWGAHVYAGMARLMPTEKHQWILELVPMRLNWETFAVSREWRSPSSALYWLFTVALVAMLAALLRREFATAVVLLGAAYAATHAVRFVALFAIVVVVIGGAMIDDALQTNVVRERVNLRLRVGLMYAALALAMFGIVVRAKDVVNNVQYVRSTYQYSLFGPGGPYRFPEGAAQFVLQHDLPGNVFNDFNSGGFVLWKLDPKYRDYIDGRGAPFGDLLVHSQGLLVQSPDGQVWEEEASSRNIHTILLALDREIGESELAGLDKFCNSVKWKPVYLDPFGAVFVDASKIGKDLPAIDCKTTMFSGAPQGDSARSRGERFNYLLNAASILIVLDRNDEALRALEEAGSLFDQNAFLHYAKGVVFRQTDRTAESEREFRKGFEQNSDEAASALALLLQQQGRYDEEANVLDAAAGRSLQPYPFYLSLGYAQLNRGHATEAMAAFERAEDQSPYAVTDPAGQDFRNQIETGRQRAEAQLRHASR